jgi:hypothetical protein
MPPLLLDEIALVIPVDIPVPTLFVEPLVSSGYVPGVVDVYYDGLLLLLLLSI